MSERSKGLSISARSFVQAILILLGLMAVTYILTLILPGGSYARVTDESGRELIDSTSAFTTVPGGIPFWKWLASPVLVLFAEGGGTIAAVIVFLLVIGGIFNALQRGGIMNYLLSSIIHRYGSRKYQLMAVIMLFFMLMGSLVGSYEEAVPLVPIVTAIAISLGWDALTGLSMSLLAVGCGFAAGIMNPFTVGIAQSLAGLPLFSGIWYRVVAFVLIYTLLLLFTRGYARRIEKKASPGEEQAQSEFTPDPRLGKAVVAFAIVLGIGILAIMSSTFIPFLQDLTMIIVAVMFLAAGIISCLLSGMSLKDLGKNMLEGIVSIFPAVLMILMASSIKYTLTEAHILDTLLHGIILASGSLPPFLMVLFIYLITLVLNFFIASGSAKAFLLIPLLVPMAQIFGISPQLVILAYAFGDGFSNVFYVTNPVLLISLGLVDQSYGKWVRFSWKFQVANLVLTSLLLLGGLAIGY